MISKPSKEQLATLQQENKSLKTLITDTENELEAFRTHAKADLVKTKTFINSVAPSLLSLYTDTAEDKFTQFSSDTNLIHALLLIEKIEEYIKEISTKIVTLHTTNTQLSLKISKLSQNYPKLAQTSELIKHKLEETNVKKELICKTLDEATSKLAIYQQSLSDLPSFPILSILSLNL